MKSPAHAYPASRLLRRAFFFLAAASLAPAAPGDLDTGFGSGGKVSTSFATYDEGHGMALQSDGKIVVAGIGGSDTALARYTTTGALDTTFNGTGKVTTNLASGVETCNCVVLQPDGKILVAGHGGSPSPGYGFIVTRYTSAGALDTSFDGDGKVLTVFPVTAEVWALAVQSDGKIVAAGSTEWGGGPGGSRSTSADVAVVRYNADGSLDTSFDGDGKMTFDWNGGRGDYCHALAIQADGKIVLAGVSTDGGVNGNVAVARLTTAGALDTTFNGTGKRIYTGTSSSADAADAAAIQPDGKILIGGRISYDQTGLLRLTSAGAMDTTFDGDGVAAASGLFSNYVYGMALQANGKIVLGGAASGPGAGSLGIVRYNVNGSLDTSLGGSGYVTTLISGSADAARGVAIDTSGCIVAAGTAGDNSTFSDFTVVRYQGDVPPAVAINAATSLTTTTATLNGTVNPNGLATTAQFEYGLTTSYGSTASVTLSPGDGNTAQSVSAAITGLTRSTLYHYRLTGTNSEGTAVTVDGTFTTPGPGMLDVAFGTGGITRTPVGSGNDVANALAVQADGRIVLAGQSNNGTNDDFALARYTAAGALDVTFGTGGKVVTAVGTGTDKAYAVAVQSDGKIVAAGTALAGGFNQFALLRYTSAGVLDASFGSGGVVTTAFGSVIDIPHGMTLQPDGKILVAGYTNNGSNNDFALVRCNPNGTLDTSFNSTGKVITAIGSGDDNGWSVALQSDGRIVVAGTSNNGSNTDFAAVRYMPNGTLDTTFNGTGKVTVGIGSGNDDCESVAIQPDGKLVLAGGSNNGSNYDVAVARFNVNGTLDTGFNATGKVTTAVGTSTDYGSSVAVQSDGKILVAGRVSPTAVSSNDFLLIRYNANGTLDSGFRGTGIVTGTNATNDEAYAVGIQPDGSIVLAGELHNGSNYDFALVRYLGNPLPALTLSAATGLTAGTATLNGTVNPNGLSTTAQFEYGLTTSYGSTASVTLSPNDGNSAQSVSAPLTGLLPGTWYHARITGANAEGTAATADGMFRTGDPGGITPLAGWPVQAPAASTAVTDAGTGVAVDPAGNVAVVGYVGSNNGDYFVAKYSPAGTQLWQQTYNNTTYNGQDFAWGVACDAAGNVYVTGHSYRGAQGSGGTEIDIYTVKYAAADGAVLWSRTYNNTSANSDDRGYRLLLDSAGNVIIGGYSFRGSGNQDFFAAKYVPSTGAVLWEVNYNGPANSADIATAMTLDAQNNVIVTGYSQNAGGTMDYVTVKYASSNRAVLWEYRWNGPANSNDYPYHVSTDLAGNVFVTGESQNADGSYDMQTLKLSGASGTLLWQKRYNSGFNLNDTAQRVVADITGNVFVTGESYSAPGNPDFYCAKYNGSTGALIWEQRYNGPGDGNDHPKQLLAAPNGDVFVIGYSRAVDDDYLTLRYRGTDGALIASARYQGTGAGGDFVSAATHGAALLPTGYPVVTGQSLGTAGYDILTVAYDGPAFGPTQVSTLAATSVAATTATLNGTVNPNGAATTAYFEFGPTTAYGSTAPVTLSPNNGTTMQLATVPVSGLTVNTLYHARLVATNANGTIYGNDVVFGYAPGALDATWNGNGIATAALNSGDDNLQQVIIQPDGKVLAVGQTLAGGNYDFAVLRYNADGSPDISFGTGGRVITAIGAGDDFAFGIALQPDGKIVVGGKQWTAVGNDSVLVRYNTNGSLDTSFDGDGKAIYAAGPGNINDEVYRVAVQPDGKIIAAGTVLTGGTNYDFYAFRCNTNGSPDTSFDGDGYATIAVGAGHDFVQAMALQSDGKILIGGHSDVSAQYDWSAIRLNANGTLDTTLDGDGKVFVTIGTTNDYFRDVEVQPDGRIVLAGYFLNAGLYDMAAARLNTNGSLDTTFDGDGKAVVSVVASNDDCYGMAIQPDGKILLTGDAYNGSNWDFATARLNPNGSLDTTFNGTGSVVTPIGSGNDSAVEVAVQPDHRIVVVGQTHNGSNYDMAIVRYLGEAPTLQATTLAATNVLALTATLNGSVNPNTVGPAAVFFEYGLTTAYGQTTTAAALSNGSTATSFQASLTGLASLSTYHYRIGAQNAEGITYGADMTFTTLANVEVRVFAGPGTVAPELTDGQVTAVNYGITLQGTPVVRSFTVQNAGTDPLAWSALSLPAVYELVGAPFVAQSIPGGGTVTFDVRLPATTLGVINGTISLTTNDFDEAVFDFPLTGNVVAPEIRVFNGGSEASPELTDGQATAVDFGTTVLGTPVTRSFTIKNAGTSDLHLTGATVPASYEIPGGLSPQTLAPGAAVTFQVRFLAHTIHGTFAGTVSVATDDADEWSFDVPVTSVAGGIGGSGGGGLDASFGTAGRVTTDFGSNQTDAGWSMAFQSDGKIVVAGFSPNNGGSFDFALARYNPNGTLDTSFGGGTGRVTTDFGSNLDDYGRSVTLQSDGKIVVAGYSANIGGHWDFAVARYNANGTLDTSFGGGTGRVTTDFGSNQSDVGWSVGMQSDGKIVVAGQSLNNGTNYDFALARFNPNGTLDTSFGGGTGRVTTDFGSNQYDIGWSAALQSDGKIVVAGYSSNNGAYWDFAVARYNANGTPDTSFGGGTGRVTTDFGSNRDDYSRSVAVQSDGKIVVAGQSLKNGTNYDFALARFNPNGTLDTSFGGGTGRLTLDFGSNGNDEGYSVVLQSDGKIVVAGYSRNNGMNNDFAVARYNPNGTPDTSFGGGTGRVTTDFGSNSEDVGWSVAVQNDGKIVVAGHSANIGGYWDFALARYEGTVITYPAPVTTTQPATALLHRGATLNGTANPVGIITNAWFEWGTTTSYGTTTPSQAIGYGTTAVPLSAVLTGLTPNQTYHYRLVAQNGETTAYGADVTFVPPNANPVATANSYHPALPGPFLLEVLNDGTADSDPDGDSIVISAVTQGTKGSVTFTAGNVTYTPGGSYDGNDSFTYTISDGYGGSATATVTLHNAMPSPVNDTYHRNEPGPFVLPVLTTGTADSDGDGDALTVTAVTNGTTGTVTTDGTTVSYAPGALYTGNDTFTYTVNDAHGGSTTASVTLTNAGPAATAATHSPAEDVPTAILLTGTDPENDALSFSIVTAPAHGTLSGTPPLLTYTSDPDYNGPDSFTFKASDGLLESTPSIITLNVTTVNDPPVTSFDVFSVVEDHTLTVALTKAVLKNDTDFHDGAPLENNRPLTAVVDIPPPGASSFTLNTNGTFTYTPKPNFHGLDAFTYRAVDSLGGQSDPETVLIAVMAENDAPVAQSQSVTTLEDVPRAIHLRGADVDALSPFDPAEWAGLVPPSGSPAPNDNALIYTITQQPLHGTLTGTAPNVVYTPAANYHGTDTLKFTVSDGLATGPEAVVTITVQPDSDGDTLPDAWEMSAFGALTYNGSDDPDLDGQDNTFELIAGHDPNDGNSCLCMESASPEGIGAGVFRLNHVRPGVVYVLESSVDMLMWDRLTSDTYEVEGPGAIYDERTAPGSTLRQYWRVRVESAPE